jgi:hypothetical protein
MITDYATLLEAARQQTEPQRLLFVFLQASLPKDYDEQQANRFHAGQGGQLQALMCVDKDPVQLTDFAELVAEAAQMEQDWQLVLVAGLSGRDGQPPDAKAIDQALKMMVQTVQGGGDLSRYMAFDRSGEPLQFG